MHINALNDVERRGAKQSMVNWSCFSNSFFEELGFASPVGLSCSRPVPQISPVGLICARRFFEDICDPVRIIARVKLSRVARNRTS